MCFAALTQSQDDMEGSLGASSFATLTFHLLLLWAEINSPSSQA